MNACFVKSKCSLTLLLLTVSLGAASCARSNNTTVSDNSNAATTNTTTTTVTKNTAPTGNANTEANVNKSTPASTPASGSATAELHTPPDGSPERKAILDAVRDYLKTKDDFPKAVFDEVETLNVHGGWAFIATDVSAPDNSPYGLVEALLQEQDGRWRVVEVFDYEGRKENEQEAIKTRHAEAPRDIFPARK